MGCGSAIKNAAGGGHIEIVKLLLERGADPNVPEEGIAPHGHALYQAVFNGHYEIARLLLEHGAYPNPEVESSADAVSIAIMNSRHGGWSSCSARIGATWRYRRALAARSRHRLSDVWDGRHALVREVAATKLGRSDGILGAYGDVATAAARLADDPTLADEPDALSAAAGNGHEEFVRLLLRYQPDLAQRVSASRSRGGSPSCCFEHGMDPNRPNWLRQLTAARLRASMGTSKAQRCSSITAPTCNARDEEHRTTPLGVRGRRPGRREWSSSFCERGARLNAARRSAVGHAAGLGDASRASRDRPPADVGTGDQERGRSGDEMIRAVPTFRSARQA